MSTSSTLLANPKPTKSGLVERSCWYRFYAMFSEKFAEEAIGAANLKPESIVLDSWLGVGTTTFIAAKSGMKAVGIDINPVMVVVANGRCIDRKTAEETVEKVALASGQLKFASLPKTDPLLGWFGSRAASAIREWQRLILTLFPMDKHPKQAGFLLTALFEAAWKLAASYRSKNPTWVKKPEPAQRVESSAARLSRLVLELAQSKAKGCCESAIATPAIQLGTSTKMDLPDSHIDFVLTSPPYCTRIDYAVSTRIELAVLGYDDKAVAELRDATMGTSTIRRTRPTADKLWGPICSDILAQIKLHPSKSSANYYYKNYVQYFADLHVSLGELHRCLKPGATAVIVVQDSRYKGMRVDLAGIVTEMASSLRWALTRRDDYEVVQTMRLVNTRSRRYRADANSVESVLWFTKSKGN